ncbi:hypothetical protein LX15_002141 [Streptoalloteichus tenebrarius]|uniref:DUF5655 domain-containing protein n=1 Tax=Streptoalloteichus tenebrarius (strain ATCC 17920 / DSM 40477 / JCM 4838 / CBS 697.72 / NBRC 16177 / NCIMB 11028 / NRRL B-12390 / A12253. 1 / ISP 5477) TaxID=1933 RepID=A0ABT1HSG4_STRSD|nr:DUF5655 domain-containing protein [Streptoalloteichus tenebrarius]MCP2258447.1 hypothetical protein [Streptoalloteichus tenebrarius]BFF03617.1 hypothetical protein GCM10020241_52920 [Streptoalloteichus tenebrarius]
MAERRDWRELRDRTAELLRRRTGVDLAEWNRRVRSAEPRSESELREWLATRGVTGYPQTVLVMERFGYPGYLLASADELIEGQYADRPALREVLDRVVEVAAGLGPLHVQARKGYVALVGPRRTFALVRASTKQRVDLGLRLPGQAPTGRLLAARSLGNETINTRIPLSAPGDVDDDVLNWLRRAYEANL